MVKIMEKPIKMDDLGIPFFLETQEYGALVQMIFILCKGKIFLG